jgi:hypothetical protein
MAWANLAAAVGVTVEFVGFGILAYELVQTNKAAVADAKELAAEKSAFDTLIVRDNDPKGGEAGTDIKGGALGAMMAQNRRREAQLAKSTRVIWYGVAITAFGSFLQVIGGIGQAM